MVGQVVTEEEEVVDSGEVALEVEAALPEEAAVADGGKGFSLRGICIWPSILK